MPSAQQSAPASLIECLQRAATSAPDKIAFRFLDQAAGAGHVMTYAEVWGRSLALADTLRSVTTKGDRAILLCEAGLDTIVALYGCFIAGVVAVPVPPPHPSRIPIQSDRLLKIVQDCSPAVILTTSVYFRNLDVFARCNWEFAVPTWLEIGAESEGQEYNEAANDIAPKDLALLQYTSGSTSAPKGVMLTHSNLLENQKVISNMDSGNSDQVYCGWVPHYHDMGMAYLLQPVFNCAPAILMSPAFFIQKPMRWMQALSDYRCTFTTAPNFALERVLDSMRFNDAIELDLSSLRVIGVGAEPVRPSTLARFASAMARFGLVEEALCPCYGLAESTVLSTLTRAGRSPVTRVLREEGGGFPQVSGASVLPDQQDRAANRIVGNGGPSDGHCVRIVDPASGALVEDCQVGEVWFSGPSVGVGYWGREIESKSTFRNSLSGDPGMHFLRTGDLGAICDGELFIVSRLKETIIINGRNLYPSDLEYAAERADPRVYASAAFELMTEHGGGAIGMVIEVERGARNSLDEILDVVRRTVSSQFEIEIRDIAGVPANHLPRTTSGKMQRDLARRRFLGGDFGDNFASRTDHSMKLKSSGVDHDAR